MKHASPAALDSLEDLLAALRQLPALTEKKRGIFYRKSIAFLHFHEDPTGLFADVKAGNGFQRLPVTTAKQRQALLKRVDALLLGL
jgi:hypothetical protein